MCLGLERQYCIDFAQCKIRGLIGFRGCELENVRTRNKSYIVFISRYKTSGICLACKLDKIEKRRWLFLTVDHECTTEDFMAAVLRVDLREAEYLTVGEFAAESF